MASAVVEILQIKLRELVKNRYHSITYDGDAIRSLQRDLLDIENFLRNSERKWPKDERTEELIWNIQEVAYEAIDEIYVYEDNDIIESRWHGLYKSARPTPHSDNLQIIINKVAKLKEDTEKSKADFSSLTVDDGGDKYQNPKDVVGFEEETNAVIGYLTEVTEELDVITMVGNPGVGMTRLAREILKHPSMINYEFTTRIWVDCSNEFKKNDLLLNILSNFVTISNEVKGMSGEELTDLLIWHLGNKKFLIILDDLWSLNDWDSLQIFRSKCNKKGKVLITSYSEEVGLYTSKFRQVLKVRPMTENESWELLQQEVFGKTECPPELETVGKLIAKECDGLQLLVVFIAGILARLDLSYGDDIKERKSAWIDTCLSISDYRSMKVYSILPTRKKDCFLYLAAFPYDHEIQAEELIRMWIAEDFIASQTDVELEESAESYLEDLIRLNLVKIERVKTNGKVKTCRISRMVHDFCKTEAGIGGEDLHREIEFIDGVFTLSIPELSKSRRLSIRSNISDFFSCKPSFPHTRSFFVFSEEEVCLSGEVVSSILSSFEWIRVLDAERIKFTHIPTKGCDLYSLTYLALSLDIDVLPAHITRLRNLQTLLVNTTSPTLNVEPNIQRFSYLRHFKTNAVANLLNVDDRRSHPSLRSITTISPESFTEQLLSVYLNTLSIRGKLSDLFIVLNFTYFWKWLRGLENLKLVNVTYVPPKRILKLFQNSGAQLKSLTLAGTCLKWSDISILASVKTLEVLKLKDKAFMGPLWKADGRYFSNLKILHIAETNLKIWKASASQFPKLRALKLRNCHKLLEVPIVLADVQSLQLLDLYETRLAADSAKRIQEKKQALLRGKSMGAQEFKLSIYPDQSS